MDNIYTVASSSSSTTYGNIMVFLKEYLIQRFSANFFKDVTVSSEISYVNIKKRLGRNTLNELSKLERPFMMIDPQIQPPSGDMYLYDIPLTKNFDNMEYGIQKNTLFDVIKNVDDAYSLKYKLNRDQIQFDIRITVDTLIQQLDLYKYMANHFVWERPYTVKTSLESMIPRDIIYQMGLLSNIDISKSGENNIPVILQCMNRHSNYPITYKMRNGTSLDEFFMYYDAEVLVNFSDLSIDSVNRKGFADDFYQITFRATIDFNLPGVYALIGMKPKPKEIQVSLASKENGNTMDLIPLYTINNLYSKYTSTRNGYVLYTTSRFQTEMNKLTKQDTLNLKILFEDRYIDVITRFYTNHVPLKTLIDIILIKDGVELVEGVDWNLKESTLDIVIENADDRATYCIVMYINNNLFNENIINDTNDSNTDKPEL